MKPSVIVILTEDESKRPMLSSALSWSWDFYY